MKKTWAAMLLCLLLCVTAVSCCAQEISHYLLLGFDYWGDETIGSSFSDTNIVVSIDKTNNRLVITSIMRDSYVTMPDGTKSKLNQVIRKSDFDTMIATVESTLGIEISGYVAISAPGFARLIGELGGVEVDISSAEYEVLKNDPNIPGPGKQVLRGNGLLAYIRNRSSGGYDRTRTERAREVMIQLVHKAKGMSAMELMAFATTAMQEVRTDMNLFDLVALATDALSMQNPSMDTFVIPADGTFKYATVNSNSIVDADWQANREIFADFLAGDAAQ